MVVKCCFRLIVGEVVCCDGQMLVFVAKVICRGGQMLLLINCCRGRLLHSEMLVFVVKVICRGGQQIDSSINTPIL